MLLVISPVHGNTDVSVHVVLTKVFGIYCDGPVGPELFVHLHPQTQHHRLDWMQAMSGMLSCLMIFSMFQLQKVSVVQPLCHRLMSSPSPHVCAPFQESW